MLLKIEKDNLSIIENNELHMISERNNDIFYYFQGYFFIDNYYYEKEKAVKYIQDHLNQNIPDIEFIKQLNGIYIYLSFNNKNKELYIFNDKICPYQIFYTFAGESLYISDDFFNLQQFLKITEFDQLSLIEFISYRFVSGKYTLLKNIFELEAGSFYYINYNKVPTIEKKVWYNYNLSFTIFENKEKELYQIMTNIFLKYKNCLTDKNISLNLTAGLDSRFLLGLMLKNSIPFSTYTFGTNRCEEIKYVRKIKKILKIDSNEYLFDKIDFISDYYSVDTIKSILLKIGFKTYYRQGYFFAKPNSNNYKQNDVLITGDNGFLAGLLYKDEIFKLKTFEELSNYLYKSSQFLPLKEVLRYLNITEIDFSEALKKRILEQFDKSNDIYSEYFKWCLLNRERNYCNRCHNFYSEKSLPIFPFYDDTFYKLMLSLSKEQLKEQKTYINSIYNNLFIDDLFKLGRITVDQRGKIGKSLNGNYIFNSKIYKYKYNYLFKLTNKYNLNTSIIKLPHYLIKKNKKLFKNKINTIISKSKLLNSQFTLLDIYKKPLSFYEKNLPIIITLIVFETMINDKDLLK